MTAPAPKTRERMRSALRSVLGSVDVGAAAVPPPPPPPPPVVGLLRLTDLPALAEQLRGLELLR